MGFCPCFVTFYSRMDAPFKSPLHLLLTFRRWTTLILVITHFSFHFNNIKLPMSFIFLHYYIGTKNFHCICLQTIHVSYNQICPLWGLFLLNFDHIFSFTINHIKMIFSFSNMLPWHQSPPCLNHLANESHPPKILSEAIFFFFFF